MSLLDIQPDNMSEILVKDIVKEYFKKYWLNIFPERINGIVFDELMNDYTENDYKDFINNSEKVIIYVWFDGPYMRLFICRSNKIPLKLNPHYTKYMSCNLWGMIDRLNLNQFKL